MRLKTLLIVLLMAIASVALADPPRRPCPDKVDTCLRVNPDARTSIELRAGTGTADGDNWRGDADVTAFAVGVTFPATADVSLLARWDHSSLDWESQADWHVVGLPNLRVNLFSVGLKLYLP